MYALTAANVPSQVVEMICRDVRKVKGGTEVAVSCKGVTLRILFSSRPERAAFRNEFEQGRKLAYAKDFFAPFVDGDVVHPGREKAHVPSVCGKAAIISCMESRTVRELRFYGRKWQFQSTVGDHWYLAEEFALDFAPYPEAA